MLKANQTKILEMKQMVNQIKTTTDGIINRQVHAKERIPGLGEKVQLTIQTDTNRGKLRSMKDISKKSAIHLRNQT